MNSPSLMDPPNGVITPDNHTLEFQVCTKYQAHFWLTMGQRGDEHNGAPIREGTQVYLRLVCRGQVVELDPSWNHDVLAQDLADWYKGVLASKRLLRLLTVLHVGGLGLDHDRDVPIRPWEAALLALPHWDMVIEELDD